MARVDFYVLAGSGETARRRFACRLAEKAYRLSHTVHIHTPDSASARQLDDLLWTYRDGSFVPHEVVTASQTEVDSPVTISHEPRSNAAAELLINLSDDFPEPYAVESPAEAEAAASFPRIAEIVTSDADSRRQSRERYARYRDLGHTLETHKL